MKEVPENDWKYFRSLQEALTERYCSETLSHIRQIVSANAVDGSLRRLQEISDQIRKRDSILSNELSDWRRSNAMWKIERIHKLGLFTNDEFEGFSPEVKAFVTR